MERAMSALKEYDARIDLKKRVTIRGAHYDHYHVTEFADGKIMLEPRELAIPFEVSRRTLAMMDMAMANYKSGGASAPVDLSVFAGAE
jgi:hypothetical protein